MADVRPAASDDRAVMASVLADAFVDDPLMSWAFPDVVTRPRLLQGMFDFLAEHLYLPAGACTLTDDAAALWLPPGVTGGDEFWAAHGEGFVASVDGQVERLVLVGAAMGQHHPHDPHRYLLALGVRPSSQGRGLGGALLDHSLREADDAGEPAYLEATSVRSRALYERHGFAVTAELSVADSPSLWPMWRAPR